MKLAAVYLGLILALLASPTLTSPLLAQTAVPDFTLQVYPGQQTVAAGSKASLNITLTSMNGFTGTVTVQQASPIFLSTSLAAVRHNFTLTPGSSQSYNATVNTSLRELGTFNIGFTATNSQLYLTHTTWVTLTTRGEPDFTITAGPTQLTTSSPFGYNVNITAGTSKQVTVTVTSYYNFTGSVELSVSTFASTNQLSYSLSPQGVTLTANNTATSTLTITAPPSAAYGGNWIFVNITGTTVIFVQPIYGGGTGYEKTETSKTTTIPVIVQAPQTPQPPPTKLLGLDPAIFYSLAGSTAVLAAIAIIFTLLKRRPPSNPPDSTGAAPPVPGITPILVSGWPNLGGFAGDYDVAVHGLVRILRLGRSR